MYVTGMHIAHLAQTTGPFEVNSLALDPDGRLIRVDPRARPFGFRFQCLGLGFVASTRQSQDKLLLQLSAKAGPLPYTAESLERRRHALAILRASRSLPHARIGVTRDGQIEVAGEIPLPPVLTAVNVVSSAAQLVLELKPYLSLLGDFVLAGWRGAPGRRGA